MTLIFRLLFFVTFNESLDIIIFVVTEFSYIYRYYYIFS